MYQLTDRFKFGELLNDLGLFGQAVEVGVQGCNFSCALLDCWTGHHLHLVDPWRHLPDYNETSNVSDAEHEELYQKAVRLFGSNPRASIHRMTSMEAVELFSTRSLDFVYIDGDHSYEHASRDIAGWYACVKVGGILAGHDYDEHFPGVMQAVDEAQVRHGWDLHILRDTHHPSWWARRQR